MNLKPQAHILKAAPILFEQMQLPTFYFLIIIEEQTFEMSAVLNLCEKADTVTNM